MGVPKGYKHGEEALEKMRQAQRDRGPVSEETKARMRASASAKFERGLPPETIENIRAGQKCRRRNEVLRLGVAEEEYDQQIANGKRWCNHCLRFMDADGFGDENKRRCRECLRSDLNKSYHRNKEGRRSRVSERYHRNEDGQKRKARNQKLRGYSATVEWHDAKLLEQNNSCGICGSSSSGPSNIAFAVDHNHACCTERKRSCGRCIRGLLCHRCNQSLERIELDPNWGTKALAYLARYPLA